MYETLDLFDVNHTKAKALLLRYTYPWEALEKLADFIVEIGQVLDETEYVELYPKVWVHKSVELAQSASIAAPCIIGAGTKLRSGAFLRGSVLIGENCVVGNSTEIKNAILFDGVQVPHYNYVGDSILGFKAHLGAGAVTSNVKLDKTQVRVRDGEKEVETRLKKLGALVGDLAEVGCNSVLNPGTVIGKNAIVYPLSFVRGTVKENCIYKSGGVVVKRT